MSSGISRNADLPYFPLCANSIKFVVGDSAHSARTSMYGLFGEGDGLAAEHPRSSVLFPFNSVDGESFQRSFISGLLCLLRAHGIQKGIKEGHRVEPCKPILDIYYVSYYCLMHQNCVRTNIVRSQINHRENSGA